jgi:hypothetical protein
MAIFRLLAKRGLRVGLIVLLVGLIFGYGHFMTPRAPDALAKVWLDVGDAMNSPGMPEYMKLRVDEGNVQEVYLNDNTLFYTLNRTSKSVPALLDYYETLYDADDYSLAPEGAKEALLERIPARDREETSYKVDETEKLVQERHVRFEGKGWGGFATIYNGDEGDPDWHHRMTERIASFKQTGLASDLGSPKIVVAFDDPAMGDTQYFNVWPGTDFDHRNVRPDGEKDAPGFDVADIQRPWGSQRMLTFGQNHGGVNYTILVYKGPGRTDEVLEGFVAEMSQDGWAVSTRFAEARAMNEDPEPSMLFIKDGKEAYVGLRTDGDDVTSTIVLYDRGA